MLLCLPILLVSCNGGGSNGSATVTKRGTTWVTKLVSPSVGALPTIVGLEAGSYQVTVSDANACTQNATVTITEPAMLLSSVSKVVPGLCHGDSTGVVICEWEWRYEHLILICGQAVEASLFQSGPLPAGAYSVQVADARGFSANITEPPALTTTILSPVNVSVSEEMTGWQQYCQEEALPHTCCVVSFKRDPLTRLHSTKYIYSYR